MLFDKSFMKSDWCCMFMHILYFFQLWPTVGESPRNFLIQRLGLFFATYNQKVEYR